MKDLLEAAKAVLPYLEASTDLRNMPRPERTLDDCIDELKLPEPERLRRRANEIEAKDAAIIRLREAVAKYVEDAA